VLAANAARFKPGNKAMRYKRYGIWQSYGWQDYFSNVKYLALGLLSLGFKPGSRLLIVGDNSPEWYFAELAAQSDRGISVGLYSDLSVSELEHVARDCEADFAIVEDQEQADKLLQIRDRLPALKAAVYWRYKGLSNQNIEGFIGLRNVLEKGRQYESQHPGVFEQNVAAGNADDICAIVYTAGTTGRPKGAMHTFRSLMTDSQRFCDLDDLTSDDDFVSYLPPVWITEQWLAFGCHLLSGGIVNFPESSETQQEDIREIAPSLVVYNSRLWESLAGQIQAKLRGASFLKRSVSAWFGPVGYRMADARLGKQNPGAMSRLLQPLADFLVFRPVRDSLGLPHARVCYTSGSTLSPQAMRFFNSLNVPLKNIYGCAEAGCVAGAPKEAQSLGSAGSVNPGVEVRVTAEGEIVARHPGAFAGYYNDPEATARVLKDGWVHTGDSGSVGPDGQLVFVDRMEDLVTLPCGERIAPQEIESRLKYSPYIKDAWVLAGQDCDFLTAVIIVDAANTGHWADKHKISYTTFRDLSRRPEVYGLIEQEIRSFNREQPPGSQVKKFVNLHKEFDPDEFELTRNRKLRRSFLGERYAGLARALSGDEKEVEVEAEFTYQDGRTGAMRTTLTIATVGSGE
jgi:long-chain acyl-CoA synthetase